MRDITRRGLRDPLLVTPTERYFRSRLGTKVIGCYTDEKSVVKLVLAMLI